MVKLRVGEKGCDASEMKIPPKVPNGWGVSEVGEGWMQEVWGLYGWMGEKRMDLGE